MVPLKILVIVLLTLPLAGCWLTFGRYPAPSACAGWQQINPEKSDVPIISDSLARQVLAHNVHGATVCDWKPPIQKAAQK